MLADLVGGERAALRRFPVEELERRVEGVRCPGCGCLSLVRVPPSAAGAQVLVRCTLPACGLLMGEDDWVTARAHAIAAARAGGGA